MTQPAGNLTPTTPPVAPPLIPEPDAARHEHKAEIEHQESRNLFILAMYQVWLRIGWIFKTETVIMPAFLDAIAGAAWLRGCLPALNRLGQSVPPLLFAERLQHMPHKKRALACTALLMAVPFLILSLLWLGLGWYAIPRDNTSWLPVVFLAFYAVFFAMTGLNQLAFSTLQGKLIPATRRGRLMTIAGIVGSSCAIVCAWYFLREWLQRDGGGFGLIFGITGVGFVISGFIAMLVKEPASDLPARKASPLREHFRRAWQTYRDDQNFRRLAWATMLFMGALMLFPHYQALGREQLGCGQQDLLAFLIAQNAGAGLFSFWTGTIADRYGNRLCLRLCMFSAATAPLIALALANRWVPGGRDWYWLTFLMLGLTPLTLRCLVNYALELVEEGEHARYVSTLTLTMAIPFLLSPLVGKLVDVLGFEAVFLTVTALVLGGGCMTFRLIEPRHN